jgi:long-chain acyl-CoA synthetase
MIQTPEKTLSSLCLASSQKYKDRPAFAMISEGKISRQVTYAQMGLRARQIGNLLNRLSVKKGEKVLLFSENCPEWPLAYFGIAFAGAVSVPLLVGFCAEQIQNIVNHSQISAICLSRAAGEKLKLSSPALPLVFIDSIWGDEISVSVNGEQRRMTLHSTAGEALHQRGDELAAIVYTSGTQGNSKGVMLTGANLISSAVSSLDLVKIYRRDRLLSVLPLAHTYECSLGLIAPLLCGASVTYLEKPPSPSVLLEAAAILRPTAMVTVPLLIEKIYRSIIAPNMRSSRLYKFPVTRSLAALLAGKKLVSALGGRIRFFGIGGAPLSPDVEKFLHSAGFPYSTGYGLTEASPFIAGNTPRRFRLNSGFSAPRSVRVRIAEEAGGDEGEIQIQGPNVMMGYYRDSEKTAEAFTSDLWLRTGDLGRIDKKGRLHIRGRLKALILGPSGENIYPEEIESLLGSSRLVEDALVYSGKKGELVALVRLSDAAKAAAGAVEHALEDLRFWVNKKLAYFSHLSRIEIKNEPFEKTPTMKIKRYLYD